MLRVVIEADVGRLRIRSRFFIDDLTTVVILFEVDRIRRGDDQPQPAAL